MLHIAFAKHVACYTDIRFEEGKNVDIESRSICPWKGWRGTLNGERQHIPHFIGSMDAVLPWLEKCPYWAVDGGPNKPWMVLAGSGEAEADSLSYAAVLALLRAHGIQIEFIT